MDLERVASCRGSFNADTGREVCQRLECFNERRATVWVPRVIDRIDADCNVDRTTRLCDCERVTQEERVAGRDICNRDLPARRVPSPIFRNRNVRSQRTAADRAKIDLLNEVLDNPDCEGDSTRAVQLDSMALPIVEAQRNAVKAIALHAREDDCGIHSA